MARLGTWEPQTVEERLDRMESLASIRQLAVRYALGVDSRDIDSLVALFVPDVRVSRDDQGREALKRWYTATLSGLETTIHLVANHIIDFEDANHAHGIVYCRDELDRTSATGEWQIGVLQYWDSYVRVDGEWCFERRRFHRFYITDALNRPSHGAGVDAERDSMRSSQLPDVFPTWKLFWDRVAEQT